MTMLPENITATKDDGQSSGTQKKLPEQGLRCPRCDSPNTKFCYYNNYNLSQPRHFCKTCRRYWTKGGALRNVPIGGGCRKNKKTRSSSRSLGNSSSYNSSESASELGGFKLFQGISPTMDFQLDGVSNFPKLNYNPQFSSYNSMPSNTNPCFGLETLGGSISSPLTGFSYPLPNVMKHGESSSYGLERFEDRMGNVHSNFASSIESLSSINQELHWKLQQQRLGMFLSGIENNQNENPSSSLPMESIDVQKPQPIMFHNLEITKASPFGLDESGKKEGGGDGDIATEWFFETPYAPTNNKISTNNKSNGNEVTSNWSDNQGWSDLNQYGALR